MEPDDKDELKSSPVLGFARSCIGLVTVVVWMVGGWKLGFTVGIIGILFIHIVLYPWWRRVSRENEDSEPPSEQE